MATQDFSCRIKVKSPAAKVFEGILQVSKWWTKELRGNTQKVGDEFIMELGCTHYSKHKLVEIIPSSKLVWLITESNLAWLRGNKEEWTNTKTIFNLQSNGRQTLVLFTHEGLVPGMECYFRCCEGWEFVIKERLFNFLTGGTDIAD